MSWVNLNDLYATKSELATKVPTSRTINGKALSSNVTLAASDIKLSDSTTLQSAWNSISHYKRIHYGSHVLTSGDPTIVIGAKEIAAIFGISTSELEDKIAPIVYNGDFAANDCIVAGSISNDEGLWVTALSGSNPYRINTILIRLFQHSISPTQLSFTKHVSINGGSISAARSGNVVVLSFFCAIPGLPTNGNTVKLFSGLPEAFIATKGFIAAQYTNFVANFWIDTDGTVCITNKSECNDAYWVVGSLVYIAAEQHSISRVSTSPKQLWSGSKSSGSITVSNSTKYSLFALSVSGADDKLFGVRLGTSGSINFTANPAWANNSASQIAVAGIRFSTNGNTWTFNGMGRYNLENNYSYGLGNVTSIYGIVQHSISPTVVWQGNTSGSLTLTIPNLKARRFIYVKADRANDFIQVPTYDMAKTEYSTICTLAVNNVYRIIDIHVFATVDGNKITLSECGYNTYDSNGLGQALALTAGYYANITEVYC